MPNVNITATGRANWTGILVECHEVEGGAPPTRKIVRDRRSETRRVFSASESLIPIEHSSAINRTFSDGAAPRVSDRFHGELSVIVGLVSLADLT